jgi:hypothetical protein
LNYIIFAYVSSKEIIDIHIYCYGYANSKDVAIIHDCTAQIKQLSKWCMFERLTQLEFRMFSYMIQALNQIFKHSPFTYFLSFSELQKSKIIASPLEIPNP